MTSKRRPLARRDQYYRRVDNTALQVGLEVGNLAVLPAQPGAGFDLLDVTGAFTHGGAVNINVAGYGPGSGFVKDLKLIGWDSEIEETQPPR